MNRLSSLALAGAALCAACGGSLASVTEYNAEASASLKEYANAMMSRAAEGDFAALHATAGEVVMFDLGPNNEPVTARGPAQVNALLDRFALAMKEPGAPKSRMLTTATECHATIEQGYCTIEFEQLLMLRSGLNVGPFRYRGTLIARRADDRWTWTHWHASFRSPPPALSDTH